MNRTTSLCRTLPHASRRLRSSSPQRRARTHAHRVARGHRSLHVRHARRLQAQAESAAIGRVRPERACCPQCRTAVPPPPQGRIAPSGPRATAVVLGRLARGATLTAVPVPQPIFDNKVMLFMKGTPEAPQCGFSAQVARIMQAEGAWRGGRTSRKAASPSSPHSSPRALQASVSRAPTSWRTPSFVRV